MPSNRRLTTLAGAAFVGIATTAMFATPASAWTASVTGTPTCDTKTGTWTVSWSVDNTTEKLPATITVVNGSVKPAGSTTTVKIQQIAAQAATKDVVLQTGVPASTPSASVTLELKWVNKNGEIKDDRSFSGSVNIPTTPCVKQTPPASSSASPSSGGTGGGGSSPTPSASTSAPALPVTGSQTGLYAGGAVVLLGAGAGLFVMARRRRVRFEA